ncbi:ABC transporter ATP-binding protein [Umezawaea tangerina]|uniref:Peptide/nickel transport system ATP-binding protein n=1 Tax=Umezawaea tangerina TaxID=84725 RepID=A0A2T0SV49_9PSEU|nr:ABC transporter ATP-binding protein [Umezawaea tangerina]PRY37285.1 peptide/nickel transport system ATP-binding protein [Umezawaea tangerina]
MTPVLEIRDLSVDYGQGAGAVHAVSSVNLVLNRGEVLGLAGESGSGKSTLAYAMTRLLPPPGLITGGEVLHHGRDKEPVDVLGLTARQLRSFRWNDIAIVFQGAMNSLNPVSTVASQLDDIYRAHRPEMSRGQRSKRSAELLRLVGISADRLGAYPHQLSGGMRQRVMIAMALALDPEIIIMDEPTTALDVVMQRQILEQMMRLREELGFSVLFITHDISLLVEFSDRIAIMYAGRIVEQAASEDMYRSSAHPYSKGLLGSFPALHGPRRPLTGIPGSPPDMRTVPSGCPFHPRCPSAFDACEREIPVLEKLSGTNGDSSRSVACWLNTPSLSGHPGVGAT